MTTTDDTGTTRGVNKPVLVIDPGHGGPVSDGTCWPPKPEAPKKPGPNATAAELLGYDHAEVLYRRELAQWRPVLREDDVVLHIAKLTRLAMAREHPFVRVHLTREDDSPVSLAARGELSEKVGASLVVPLHINAYSGPGRAQGCIAFVLAHDDRAAMVARAMLDEMPAELRRTSRDLIVADRSAEAWTAHAQNCLEPHRDRHPALIELGFATDSDDRAALTDPAVQGAIAVALCHGVAVFLAA